MTIEVCCPDIQSVQRAIEGRADRIELCRALELDGLTPTREDIRMAVNMCHRAGVKVHVLIRSREGDFTYSTPQETRQMDEEITMALDEGADGVVLGALTPEGDIDTVLCRAWIETARRHPRVKGGELRDLGVTFHRAFDVCRNPMEAVEDIIALGCNRLLTSGQAPSAVEGIPLLARLVQATAGRLTILAGAGVSAANYSQIMEETGVGEVHGSFRGGIPRRDKV